MDLNRSNFNRILIIISALVFFPSFSFSAQLKLPARLQSIVVAGDIALVSGEIFSVLGDRDCNVVVYRVKEKKLLSAAKIANCVNIISAKIDRSGRINLLIVRENSAGFFELLVVESDPIRGHSVFVDMANSAIRLGSSYSARSDFFSTLPELTNSSDLFAIEVANQWQVIGPNGPWIKVDNSEFNKRYEGRSVPEIVDRSFATIRAVNWQCVDQSLCIVFGEVKNLERGFPGWQILYRDSNDSFGLLHASVDRVLWQGTDLVRIMQNGTCADIRLTDLGRSTNENCYVPKKSVMRVGFFNRIFSFTDRQFDSIYFLDGIARIRNDFNDVKFSYPLGARPIAGFPTTSFVSFKNEGRMTGIVWPVDQLVLNSVDALVLAHKYLFLSHKEFAFVLPYLKEVTRSMDHWSRDSGNPASLVYNGKDSVLFSALNDEGMGLVGLLTVDESCAGKQCDRLAQIKSRKVDLKDLISAKAGEMNQTSSVQFLQLDGAFFLAVTLKNGLVHVIELRRNIFSDDDDNQLTYKDIVGSAQNFHVNLDNPQAIDLRMRNGVIEGLVNDSSGSFAIIHNARNGKSGVTTFRVDPCGDFMITSEGFFSASNPGCLAGYTVDRFSLPEYFDVFHRPDIVQAKLRGEDIHSLIGDLTLEKAILNPPPKVRLGGLTNESNAPRMKISYVISPDVGGVAEVRVFQNGKLISSDGTYKDARGKTYIPVTGSSVDASRYAEKKKLSRNAKALEGLGSQEENQPGSLRNQMIVRGAPEKICTPGKSNDPCKSEIDVEVIPGEENTITVVAFNRDNTIQSVPASVSFKSTLPKEDPHLWVVGVGINKFSGISSLKNARKDALDFVCSYAGKDSLVDQGVPCTENGQARTLFKQKNIHVIDTLFDETATKSHILNALDKVASQAKPGDTFVWFVASHGMMDANSLFGIIAYDTKCLNKNCTDISGHITSNEILEASKKIKAMKQLVVLDTCHSGGLDAKLSGLYDARVSLLAKNMGLHLYASAQATELAQDGAPGTNGAFTAQLLEGIKGAAPKNSEGQISVMTLGAYAKQKTVEATAKVGSKDTRVAQTPVIQHFGQDVGLARFPSL